MKKLRLLLVASLICMTFAACEKEEEDTGTVKTYDHFILKNPQFNSNNTKVHLDYTNEGSRLLYDAGDIIHVNGYDFTLSKSGSGPATVWTATGENPVTATQFHCAYVDGTVGLSGPNYSFDLTSNIGSASHTKLLLAGSSDSNVVTLSPACAILRFYTEGASYNYVKVGFTGDRIPVRGTLSATSGKITSVTQYLAGVTQGGGGQFLYMTPGADGVSFYVAIPIEGDNVTTTLYLEWQKQGGSVTQYKTSGQVTLTRGYVYTVGSARVSPFTANGVSSCSFLVGASKEVLFSAGNLQWKRKRSGSSYVYEWKFADHQYDVIGSGNSHIGENAVWIDLMGYGTSGSSYAPNLSTTTNSSYPSTNIAGTNMDWGQYIKNSPGILYGSKLVTSENWRTLTSDEWTYLIGRSGKCGLATIGGSYKGLLLLPDYDEEGATWYYETKWPEGVAAFVSGSSSGYTTNNFSFDDWAKIESAGAIFLPVTGQRSGTNVLNTNNGYYWSTTIGSPLVMGMNTFNQAKNLQITSSSYSITQAVTQNGHAVRLVIAIE